ncbi:MAG: hypothetical protein IJH70_14895 [Oscillospiraceae bacterium]|nr:hypothetical protein [Oscillospiraceae bacterium]
MTERSGAGSEEDGRTRKRTGRTVVSPYERIADHCSNVALAMLRLKQGDFETHDYEEQLLRERRPEFERMYTEFRKKYGVG